MMTLPGRVTVATARVVALLELAEWGARSEADRLLVLEVRNDMQRLGEKYTEAQKDAGDHSRLGSGAAGALSTSAGDGDNGGAGAESNGSGSSVVGGGQ